MRRWASDMLDFCGVTLFVITQKLSSGKGWETFISADGSNSARLATFESLPNLTEASRFHAKVVSEFKLADLDLDQTSRAQVRELVKSILTQVITLA